MRGSWMQQIQERGFGPDDAVYAAYMAIVFANSALSMGILAGGDARFPYPTYQPLLDLTNGHVWPWGASIGIAAIFMAVHSRYANLFGLALSFAWYNLFSAMFAVAIVQYDTAGATAPVPYLALAMIHVALITLKIVEIRRARKA